MFDKLVYGKLRAALGGNCIGAVSGGAPLGDRLGHFFRGVGIPVYEAYGLTETSAGILANSADDQRIGSVGRRYRALRWPSPTTARSCSRARWCSVAGQNEKATADSIQDGWFYR